MSLKKQIKTKMKFKNELRAPKLHLINPRKIFSSSLERIPSKITQRAIYNPYQVTSRYSKVNKKQVGIVKKFKERLLDPMGKLPDAELKEIALGIEFLHDRDKRVLIGIAKAVFRSRKVTFSQNYLAVITGIGQTSISKSLKRMVKNNNNLFEYSRELKVIPMVLGVRHNGFKVEEGDTYKKNKVTQNMSSYIFNEKFIDNLPYLAKLSRVCGKIFALFRKKTLMTRLKRSVLNNLGTKQFDSFKRFSIAALLWAGERLKEKLFKHTKIRDKERFLWSVCIRYDREYNMLRE